jgi:uncharacterized protein
VEKHWQPVGESERHTVLDLVRGVALFGVLLINLLNFFRVSLFSLLAAPPPHDLVARLIEFKALDLFSITFGVGVGVQAERAWKRRVTVRTFLARRFLVLLAFGLVHMIFVSNVDILTLYALCGLALIPVLRAPTAALATVGVAAVFGPSLLPTPSFPEPASLAAHAAEATRVYSQSGYGTELVFRWHETVRLIVPILIASAQRTFGLMLVGIAVWRSGVVPDPAPHRRLLWLLAAVGAAVGLAFDLDVPLAVGYGSALLAANPQGRWTRPFAAAGRMAFTNYLTQTVVLATVFYGFGLFGKLGRAPAAAMAVAFYGVQLWFSAWWLGRHRFGPFEWLWRSFTYGRRM